MRYLITLLLLSFVVSCGSVEHTPQEVVPVECEHACVQWYQWADECGRTVPCSPHRCVEWMVENDCNDQSGYDGSRCEDTLMQIPSIGVCVVPAVGSCWPIYCEE